MAEHEWIVWDERATDGDTDGAQILSVADSEKAARKDIAAFGFSACIEECKVDGDELHPVGPVIYIAYPKDVEDLIPDD